LLGWLDEGIAFFLEEDAADRASDQDGLPRRGLEAGDWANPVAVASASHTKLARQTATWRGLRILHEG